MYVSWQPHVGPYIKFINKKDLTSVMLNNLPATETWGLKQKELDELNGIWLPEPNTLKSDCSSEIPVPDFALLGSPI